VSVDLSFDKDYLIPGKTIKLKISPNANNTGDLVLSGDQIKSWSYYVWSGDEIVDS
jgi:predicted RecA/RadA family phage recombinase